MQEPLATQPQSNAGERASPAALNANVSRLLTAMAARRGDAIAIAAPGVARAPYGSQVHGNVAYHTITFRALDEDSSRLAAGLRSLGVERGTRLALLVRPGIEFISLVFAAFKAGAVAILIDPGMGRKNLIRCLSEAEPQGFIAIPLVHAVRRLFAGRFPRARYNVTVGGRWFRGDVTLDELRSRGAVAEFQPATAHADEPAAIIFTTGSTGPPKGVLYGHGNFDHQVSELGDFYGIRPGEVDLPGFPLFALFNAALGVTTVIPDLDPRRPARVDPRKIVQAVNDWRVTQAFGSPAIWNRVGLHCQQERVSLPSLARVLSAGAPVPPHVLARMKACIANDGQVHTPYGATEALPVASIEAAEVLGETAQLSRDGAGVCVGRKFPTIEWRVVPIVDGPIADLAGAGALEPGEIGELVVSGPVVTRRYVTRREWNALSKILGPGGSIWHRMGDAGYLDERGRFWFCGRVAHRVRTAAGTMYSVRCEAIFNNHPDVFRSALVGVGSPGRQRPVIIAEPHAGRMPRGRQARERLFAELRALALGNPLTGAIVDFLVHPSLPVDIRHNAKIFREKLAVWAATRLTAARLG